jgi:MFS transporter, ACDE family, multidrug resistance protein
MRALNLPAMFGLGSLSPDRARALSLVYAASMALMMGVNFIQPALPALTGPFAISDSALSLLMTVFTAPAIVLAPVFGVIADLYGRRLLLAGGLIIFGLFGTAMAFAPSFTWLLVFRTLQGIGYSAVIPLTIVLIGDLLEGDNEIGGQGLKVFLDRIGYMIFPPLGGLLATIAWFWPFTLYILTIPVGLAALIWMPETKAKSEEKKTLVYLGDMLRLTRHPRLVIAFSAGFLRFFLDYGFLTYFPLFLVRSHGISTATAGLLYVFFSIGAMITSSQAGRIAAGRDKAHILFMAFIISGAAVVAVPFLGIWLVGCALFFYGMANGVISPMQKSLLTQNAPTELRGGIISFDRLIQQVSKTTSTSIVGLLLVSANLSTLFWFLGILSFLSVGLMACLVPRPKQAVASETVS